MTLIYWSRQLPNTYTNTHTHICTHTHTNSKSIIWEQKNLLDELTQSNIELKLTNLKLAKICTAL